VRSFSTEVIVPRAPADTRALALDKLSEPLRKSGYEMTEGTGGVLTFNRESAFRWPLRLLFPQSSQITMTFEAQPGNKTRMVVAGTAPRRIARDFEQLAG
jgi:hypothetical protein